MNIVHAKQLVTLAGPSRARSGPEMRQLEIIEDGAISMRGEIIEWVGKTDNVPHPNEPTFDASGKVVLPGFVDSHTHAVFAGSRLDEFQWRIEGASYMDILNRGGGILSTTRSVQECQNLQLQLADRFFEHGTTTIEAKSGYGLCLADEIRLLEAMKAEPLLEVVRTYLGAHALPNEYRDNRDGFVDQVLNDLPVIAERRLAEFCDVFVEPGAFTPDDARRIFAKAKTLGLQLKVHADEFADSGGAALAVEVGAVSADHLGAVTPEGIQLLANSGVVATLLPSTLFMLGQTRYAPARALIDAGAAVALATDFNPGTSPTLNMQWILTLACTQMRMTPAEAVSAATINGAAAIRRCERLGSVEPGKQADVAIYDVNDYREIPYHAAMNFCSAVFKRGELVYESNRRVRPEL